jgi:hypothetical protein
MPCIRCNANSFGEAFHVSAAAILDEEVTWRVECGAPTQQHVARSFLLATAAKKEGGASDARGGKATTRVADAFTRSSCWARFRLRRRWLSIRCPLRREVQRFADSWMEGLAGRKVVFWNRDAKYKRERNTANELRDQVAQLCNELGFLPMFVGHPFGGPRTPCDLTELWKKEPFLALATSHQLQLYFFWYLRREHGLVAQVGNKSGALDGHALLGLPTVYFENAPMQDHRRMEKWLQGVVPNYERVTLTRRDAADLGLLTVVEQAELQRLLGRW